MTKIVCTGLMKHVFAIVVLCAALIIGDGKTAVFAQSANLVFIIDASGSMDGRLSSGEPSKIDMVREALSETVGSMSSDRRVGVVAFGHRNKGDCDDVEELVPMVPLIGNRELVIGNIEGITPVGMTPLGFAISQSAEMLNTRKESGEAVVIADGQDSCTGDPCELVRRLKGSNARFVVHVIGLNVTQGAENQLVCVAEAGGGQFFHVRSAQELKSALKTAMAGAGKTEKRTDTGEESGETGDAHAAKTDPQADVGDLPGDEKPTVAESPENETQKAASSLVTKSDVGNIRESPALESAILFRVTKGDIVFALEKKGEWFRIESGENTGWGHESLFVELPVKDFGTVEKISVQEGQEEDKVIFEMNRTRLPKISFLKSDTPKVACDFADTAPAERIGPNIAVSGKRIRGINAGVWGENGFRVVLDLAPGEYELAHIFNKNETRYVLIVKNRAQNNGTDG